MSIDYVLQQESSRYRRKWGMHTLSRLHPTENQVASWWRWRKVRHRPGTPARNSPVERHTILFGEIFSLLQAPTNHWWEWCEPCVQTQFSRIWGRAMTRPPTSIVARGTERAALRAGGDLKAEWVPQSERDKTCVPVRYDECSAVSRRRPTSHRSAACE